MYYSQQLKRNLRKLNALKSINKFPTVLFFLLPLLLLFLLVGGLCPYYQYYIDPDAVSYLTLVERYLAGDYEQAINAYWSPMGVWLTVVWVKINHWEAFAAALFVNTLGAAGVVGIGQVLFHRFRNSSWERFCFGILSACFWATVVYRQSFTDVWQIFFLLIALLILLRDDFLEKKYYWFLLGFIGALAYFSKAFSFYFLPLMTFLALIIQMKSGWKKGMSKIVTPLLVICGTMLLFSLPWLYVLHQKYGVWVNSTAGKMNLGWQLLGHPHFKDDIKILVPPVHYTHSLFYFEDAYLVEAAPVSLFDHPIYIVKLLARIALNLLDWVRSSNFISPFYFVTWLLTALLFFMKKQRAKWSASIQILMIICLIYPLPYLLLTFDKGRYLWFTIPLMIIIGLHFYDMYLKSSWGLWLRRLFIFGFFASFLPMSVFEMKDLFNKGKEDYEMAQQLKDLNIQGGFVLNAGSMSPFGHSALRLAYWTKSPFYSYGLEKWTTQDILEDASRYPVKYFFYRYNGSGDDYELHLLNGEKAEELTQGQIKGLKVFALQ